MTCPKCGYNASDSPCPKCGAYLQFAPTPGSPTVLKEENAQLRNRIAALEDAIAALKDFVDGKRHDTENIAGIINGALCVPENVRSERLRESPKEDANG